MWCAPLSHLLSPKLLTNPLTPYSSMPKQSDSTSNNTLTRYVALLRGVSPLNAKMPALKAAFEAAGLQKVRTVLSSGNVVFSSNAQSAKALESLAEGAMKQHLARGFSTIVRSVAELRLLVQNDPFEKFSVEPGAKRVVSFCRKTLTSSLKFPHHQDGVTLHSLIGRELYCSYVPHPKGPIFMQMIDRQFGDTVTTRTWDTVGKVIRAAALP